MKKVYVCFILLFAFTQQINAVEQKQTQFAIIIASYNNEKYAFDNLKSVFEQEYNDYHVYYVNDCSSDNTINIVRETITEFEKWDQVTLIDNKTRKGAMANQYAAIHRCSEDAVAVILDGDDQFAHKKVLARLNRAYQDPDVWVTYGQFRSMRGGFHGYARPYPERIAKKNGYRKYRWLATHLRTFYVWLFKRIDKKDFMYRGQFMQMCADMAIMFPLLEMAGPKHVQFVPHILCLYNNLNPLNDHRKDRRFQVKVEQYIRAKKPYDRIVMED